MTLVRQSFLIIGLIHFSNSIQIILINFVRFYNSKAPTVHRIETKQAPVPSQPEVVLSDGKCLINDALMHSKFGIVNLLLMLKLGHFEMIIVKKRKFFPSNVEVDRYIFNAAFEFLCVFLSLHDAVTQQNDNNKLQYRHKQLCR